MARTRCAAVFTDRHQDLALVISVEARLVRLAWPISISAPAAASAVGVVRHWFKQRGLYSNKLGFLGGVNFNILVAFVCRLYVERWPACVVCSAHLRCSRLLRSR